MPFLDNDRVRGEHIKNSSDFFMLKSKLQNLIVTSIMRSGSLEIVLGLQSLLGIFTSSEGENHDCSFFLIRDNDLKEKTTNLNVNNYAYILQGAFIL